MLKQWIAGGEDLGSIHVEERFTHWVNNQRTDKYVTVTRPETILNNWVWDVL